MSTYVIGDVQGCFAELKKLLDKINFDQHTDTLWFTGDLVNRGPASLEVLRFIKALGNKHIIVLGNHDLHLLAVGYGVKKLHREDTLEEILKAPDKEELLNWLRHLPLLYYDQNTQMVMTHAGLAPLWTLNQAQQLAHEVEIILQSDVVKFFLESMYGNDPDQWSDQLTGIERWRCITNYLTRMRFCYVDGRLELFYKGEIKNKPKELMPWFEVPDRLNAREKIIFGHWAALGGKTPFPHLYPMDTGCIWGNCLTAMRIEDEKRFSVPCHDVRVGKNACEIPGLNSIKD